MPSTYPGKEEKLIAWDRAMGIHSQFPECCIEEWCENMRKVGHDISHDDLFGIAAEKKAIMGANGAKVFFVPCMKCAKEIGAGRMEPPKTHKCTANNPACQALWKEAERLTGYTHRILK